jgi:hypothetical protein
MFVPTSKTGMVLVLGTAVLKITKCCGQKEISIAFPIDLYTRIVENCFTKYTETVGI